jgi:hypothetical protein
MPSVIAQQISVSLDAQSFKDDAHPSRRSVMKERKWRITPLVLERR